MFSTILSVANFTRKRQINSKFKKIFKNRFNDDCDLHFNNNNEILSIKPKTKRSLSLNLPKRKKTDEFITNQSKININHQTKLVNMDVSIDEHRFDNFYDYNDTINSSKLMINIMNDAHRKRKEAEKFDLKQSTNNTIAKKSLLNNQLESSLNMDEEFQVQNNSLLFVTLNEAKQFESSSFINKIDDNENIKCIANQLQNLWCRRDTTSLIFFYKMFSFLFKQYLTIGICIHKYPCPMRVNLIRFKRFAVPIMQIFIKFINPNKNLNLQIELLAAIESLICHKQQYLIAVSDIFDQLLRSSLIEPCAFPPWSRLKDPLVYTTFNLQSKSTKTLSNHQKLIKSKSTPSGFIDTDKNRDKNYINNQLPTVRSVIIKKLKKDGIPLSIDKNLI